MPYTCIVADPPWPTIHNRSTYNRGKPQRHYPVMALNDILGMKVGELATDSAHLWIWGINRTLHHAYQAAEAWGFTPMSLLTWCKPGPGMGYYLRNNTEHCVFATRGRPMVPAQALLSSWHTWPRKRHSEKPEAFFGLVEQVSPGPYLELFARVTRPGWDCWGNEAPGGLDVDLTG